MEKNSVAIVIAYFGKFPQYFPLTLESMKRNSNIDWIFFTDQEIDNPSENIFVHNMNFSDFRDFIQKHFEFEIALDAPYKICDFRPAFGFVFEQYLRKYEFWGHCDLDIILGKIIDVLPAEAWDFDKILLRGSLGFYRNIPKVNNLFRLSDGATLNYHEVFSNSKNYLFDEWHGIVQKFIISGIQYWNDDKVYFDINKNTYRLKTMNGNRTLPILSDSGRVFMLEKDSMRMVEGVYIHLQKRRVDFSVRLDFTKPLKIRFNRFYYSQTYLYTPTHIVRSLIIFYFDRFLAMKKRFFVVQ